MKASAVHILTDGYPLASESWPAALPFSCHDLFLFTHLVVWPISFQKNYFITLIRQHTERCLHELGYVIKRGKSPFKSLNLPAGRMSKQKKKNEEGLKSALPCTWPGFLLTTAFTHRWVEPGSLYQLFSSWVLCIKKFLQLVRVKSFSTHHRILSIKLDSLLPIKCAVHVVSYCKMKKTVSLMLTSDVEAVIRQCN